MNDTMIAAQFQRWFTDTELTSDERLSAHPDDRLRTGASIRPSNAFCSPIEAADYAHCINPFLRV